MILDNLSRALKTQNWLAAGVEFVIVIVGVVIGFQINAWAENRSERAEERVILENLHADFLLIRDDPGVVRRAALTTQAPDDLRWLIEAIRTGDEPDDVERLRRGLRAALEQYAPTPGSSTFEELQSSGRLSLIKNPALRQALTRFAEVNEIEWTIAVDTRAPVTQSTVLEHVRLDLDGETYTENATYDFEGLAASQGYLQRRLMDLDLLAEWTVRSREQAVVILSLLELELAE